MDQKRIGSFLRELRKERGITQEDLAEKLNVSSRTISRWETGSNMPDISLLIEIADFFDVSIPEIINGERKSEKMNEEVKEVAEKLSDYADAEKVNIIKEIRSYKADNKLPLTYKAELNIYTSKSNFEKLKPYLLKVGMLKSINLIDKSKLDNTYRFVEKNIAIKVYSDELAQANKIRIEKRIIELKAEIERSTKMLSNPNFINKAPKAKVDLEKQKLENYQHELDNYLK